ncbi:glycosyltransferase [Vibrio porteresiae]|uniref:Glycosyltransferase n=1 Tax=Vibrio porteresiae DSM 19223 TaxID=1123496 RepID=A0ABZ0Q8V4_9VIBR|nr:glycosyltransferase [Vibrio porteresiae]WPC72882.1 glycosyltransferase [Vibrio porteresiae DSM 19223]
MSEKKIRICHLVYSFDVGGLERIIVNCINNLKNDNFCHVIVSLTKIGDFYSEIDIPVECYSLDKKDGNDIGIYFRLYKLLNKLHPDVIHTYNLATMEYQWVAWLVGVPQRIHAEHGRDSYDPHGTVQKYRWLRRVTSMVTHHIVAVSADLHQWLIHDVRIPQRKVSLIINGVDTQHYVKSARDAQHHLSFCQDKCVFGHVARLHQIKNQPFLLEAFRDACAKSGDFAKDCVLLIVGDGPDRAKLESFVRRDSWLKDRVCFTGSKTEVIDYYKEFDVFLMSSFAEGIPMTLIESMSMAIPHLVTKVGGIGEVIIDNETGLSVASGDHDGYVNGLIELYRHRELRETMGQKARQQIEQRFSQNQMVAAYQALYLERDGQ